MKILLTGANGAIGSSLKKLLPFNVAARSHHELDITDKDAIAKAIDEVRPDLIINSAVIKNPLSEEKKELACQVNVIGVKNLCETGIKLLQISSVVVLRPKDWYSVTKLAAESLIDANKHLIIRLSFPHNDVLLAKAVVNLIDKTGVYNLWELQCPYLKNRIIIFLRKVLLKLQTEPGGISRLGFGFIKRKVLPILKANKQK